MYDDDDDGGGAIEVVEVRKCEKYSSLKKLKCVVEG